MAQQPLDFLRDYNEPNEKKELDVNVSVVSSQGPSSDGTDSTPTGRKILRRKRRVEITKRDQQRAEAQERRRQARHVIEVECKCHLSCPKRINLEQRRALNNKYWEMDTVTQRQYVKTHSVPGPVKRRRVPADPLGGLPDVKKAFSYAFYLPDEHGELMMVCCTFFLNTLGFRKGCGNHIYRAHTRDGLENKRGKYERDRSLRDAVWDDILSYSPRTYHKGSKFSPTAMYLPSNMTAKAMHAEFKARREAYGEKGCSASFYCAVLREIDIRFVDMDDFVMPERKPIPVVVPKPPSTPPPPMETVPPVTRGVDPVEIVEIEEPKIQMKIDKSQPECSYPATLPTYQPFQTVPVVEHQPQHGLYSYTGDQKPVLPQYVPGPYHSIDVPFQPVIVKQEPYYGMNVEPMSVSDSHFTEENGDGDYSNMTVHPDYSESNSYHEPYEPAIQIEKIEAPTDFYSPFVTPEQHEQQAINAALPVQPNPKISKPKTKPVKTKPIDLAKLEKDIAEGYSPMKRTKKFMTRVRNQAKRQLMHPVVEQGCNNCYLNCKEKIPTEQQEVLNKRYWGMTFPEQRMFMLEHTERHSIKRRRAKVDPETVVRKGFTYSYRLTDDQGQYQQVCCQFYLNTLGYTAGCGNLIYRAHQVELSRAISDNRGKFTRDRTLRDAVDDDITSYFSAELQESGGPFDLSATDWSPKKMYNIYVQRQAALGIDKPGSFAFYWRRTRELKVIYAPKPEPKNPGQKKYRRRRPPTKAQKQLEAETLSLPVQFPVMPLQYAPRSLTTQSDGNGCE
ncbi:uncharacterized protein LOC134213667 [Armigeres subalbatus]|uniref:uncharacterized protein LOC134213667 n=1 Tax=Armigeres subalbatus TaxID=124917 RepID=UPI002ED34FA0